MCGTSHSNLKTILQWFDLMKQKQAFLSLVPFNKCNLLWVRGPLAFSIRSGIADVKSPLKSSDHHI